MVITKDKAIELLKQGNFLCEEIWGGYHYTISGGYTLVFSTARKLIESGLVVEDKTKGKSPLLKWYKWNIIGGQDGEDHPRDD